MMQFFGYVTFGYWRFFNTTEAADIIENNVICLTNVLSYCSPRSDTMSSARFIHFSRLRGRPCLAKGSLLSSWEG